MGFIQLLFMGLTGLEPILFIAVMMGMWMMEAQPWRMGGNGGWFAILGGAHS